MDKRPEEGALNHPELLRGIIDNATDAIVSIDEKHRIILFNRSAERIFGYKAAEVLGKDLDLLLPPHLQGKHYQYIERFLQTGSSEVFGKIMEGTVRRKNGELFPIRISRSPTQYNNHWIFTAIMRDISKRKELEKRLIESEKLAAVGMAVLRVVHEIKNPLLAIGGFVHSLYHKERDLNKKKKFELVLREVNRLEKLLKDISQFGKPLKLEFKEVNLINLCQDALDVYRPRFKELKIQATFKAPETAIFLKVDEERLKEVLFNIMQNAMEMMPNGGRLELEIKAGDEIVTILIRDTGPGISKEVLEQLFTPFFTTKKQGTGLGLSISRKIIEAHGGHISARNYEKGAEFSITLPRKDCPPLGTDLVIGDPQIKLLRENKLKTDL